MDHKKEFQDFLKSLNMKLDFKFEVATYENLCKYLVTLCNYVAKLQFGKYLTHFLVVCTCVIWFTWVGNNFLCKE